MLQCPFDSVVCLGLECGQLPGSGKSVRAANEDISQACTKDRRSNNGGLVDMIRIYILVQKVGGDYSREKVVSSAAYNSGSGRKILRTLSAQTYKTFAWRGVMSRGLS